MLDRYRIVRGSSNLPAEQLAREPQAGGVFRVRPGVSGLAAVDFAGSESLREVLDKDSVQG